MRSSEPGEVQPSLASDLGNVCGSPGCHLTGPSEILKMQASAFYNSVWPLMQLLLMNANTYAVEAVLFTALLLSSKFSSLSDQLSSTMPLRRAMVLLLLWLFSLVQTQS